MDDANQRDRGGIDFTSTYADLEATPQADGSFSKEQLWRFIWDLQLEPDWRSEAELDNAFYDGDQLDQPTLIKMRDNGMLPVVNNVVGATVDSVVGLEVITRSDLRCLPENEESFEVAMAMNVKFKEATRMTRFGHHVGMQFKQMCKQGIGWMEVSRNPDPFEYPYRNAAIDWRQMYVDHRARAHDYEDKRYLIRRNWFDGDVLLRYFPNKEHQRIIKNATSGLDMNWLLIGEELGHHDLAAARAMHLSQEMRFTLEEDEWRQQLRGRVPLYEILYYVPLPVEVIMLNSGHVITLDRKSDLHLEILRSKKGYYRKGVTKQWRQAFYVSSERLTDRPLRTNRPHYIPMVGYRKDNDGSPYGIIRRMRSPQDNLPKHTLSLIHI